MEYAKRIYLLINWLGLKGLSNLIQTVVYLADSKRKVAVTTCQKNTKQVYKVAKSEKYITYQASFSYLDLLHPLWKVYFLHNFLVEMGYKPYFCCKKWVPFIRNFASVLPLATSGP